MSNKKTKDKNTKDKYEEQRLAAKWDFKFKEAMVAKAPYIKQWNKYWDAYNGEYFKNEKLPEYRSDLVSNFIFSIIETIRPIMLDNNPKFQATPRQPEGMKFSGDLNQALLYEWDRERMKKKLSRDLITTLVIGTHVYFLPWDKDEKNIKAVPVNPYNIFPDPLATCEEDAEYIIYASYKNAVRLKRKYPDKADDIRGGDVKHSELVYENDQNSRFDNQVLVLEVWTWDVEEEFDVDGEEKHKQKEYKNGRVITLCPELSIILDDKESPYNDGQLPFVLVKDFDIPGKFWGEGEVAQLLSPQKHMNDLNNAILDNAKATANMPWIVDKNAGVGQGKITARPGLVIRKNPGSEVRREQPPAMPAYVVNAVESYKSDIESISGIYDTLKGDRAQGVYTAQGIMALQEAGQTRIRLKVDLMEDSLGKLGQMWFNRMKQFWNEDRWLLVTKHDGSYDMKRFTTEPLEYDYDIKVTAGSTMKVNRGAMLDLMIRLAQTQMPDGQPLVDREAVVEYLPEEVKSAILERMQDKKANLLELQQAVEQLGQALEQTAQELQQSIEQVHQESSQNDEQIFGLIEELTSAVEHINKQILRLNEEHDKIESERAEKDKEDGIKREAYNQGYTDAESLYTEEDTTEEPMDEMQRLENIGGLPDDILEGLEALSDDELAVILENNPEIANLIR